MAARTAARLFSAPGREVMQRAMRQRNVQKAVGRVIRSQNAFDFDGDTQGSDAETAERAWRPASPKARP